MKNQPVEYFCPCREPQNIDSEVPTTLEDAQCFWPLEYLYFCQHCGTPRCPNCIDSEPVVIYCPTCQNAVSAKMAAHTGNRCPRNCLACGACGANTLVANRGDSYGVQCAVCDWEFDGLEKRSFAAQILERRRGERDRLEAVYRGEAAAATRAPPASPLPSLVPLKSRCQRACRACRTVLVKPDAEPGAKFELKSMAMAMIPRASVYNNTLLITNALSIPVSCGLSSRDLMLGASTLDLGPLTAQPEAVHELRQVPAELVERESAASKQVFMSGTQTPTSSGAVGPNWATTKFEVPAGGKQTVNLLMTVRYQAQASSHQINLWIRWRQEA